MMAPSRNPFIGLALALMTVCYAIPAPAQATSGGASAKNLDPADWEPILLESATATDVPPPEPVEKPLLARLLLDELDEPCPPPPLLRVTPPVTPTVGNRLARASPTSATALRYCASNSFTVWLDTATIRSSLSSSGSW